MMFNLFNLAKDFVFKRTRLFIEYLLIGFIVSLGAITFTLWLQKDKIETKLEAVQGKVISLEIANSFQDTTITTLQTLRSNDAIAIDNLVQGYQHLAKTSKEAATKLKYLEQNNVKVREFMRSPLPDELKCLRNQNCTDTDKNNTGIPNAPKIIDEPLPIPKTD